MPRNTKRPVTQKRGPAAPWGPRVPGLAPAQVDRIVRAGNRLLMQTAEQEVVLTPSGMEQSVETRVLELGLNRKYSAEHIRWWLRMEYEGSKANLS